MHCSYRFSLAVFFSFLAAVILAGSSAEELAEGSGTSEVEDDMKMFLTVEYGLSYDTLLRTLFDTNVSSEPKYLNASLQLQLVRIEEELFRGRIGLTLWLIEQYKNAEYAFPDGSGHKRIKLSLDDDRLKKLENPKNVVKNALYFKQHRTPYVNGFAILAADGTVSTYQKVTVDLPCVTNKGQQYPMLDDSFPVCARGYGDPKSHRWGETSCELRYGSYFRDQALLNLDWNFNAISRQTVPCFSSSRGKDSCNIRETQTLKRQTEFAGEDYDELVACFIVELMK